jgi:hypothetical protein
MIRITEEGGMLKPGFNFYPLSDKASFGVRIMFGKSMLQVRYAKIRKKWIVYTLKLYGEGE